MILFRRLILASILPIVFAATSAMAQVAVYATFSPIHISGVASGNKSGINAGYSTSSYWAYGVGGGATFDIVHGGPVALGLDVRGSTRPGTQGADTFFGGLKLGFDVPATHLKPYVQVSGGYLGVRGGVTTGIARGSTNPQHFAAYEFLGGVDYTLNRVVAVRIVEIGAGQGIFTSGANDNDPNISFITLNTGLVLHF